ncbi:Son of sevenless-like protein 1 [Aphelenchoides bicaudatus]|nr:Son of sevenless-like protein 1 [Aphelenchoides bicaudatus]
MEVVSTSTASTAGFESIPTPNTPSAKAVRFEKKRLQWRDLFTERIYMTCNITHPGIGMEQDAVTYITEILNRILFELLEQAPENLDDLSDKVRSTFPSTLAYFVMKNHDPKEDLHNLLAKNKSKEAKSLSALYHRLQTIIKEELGRKLEDVAVMLFVSIFEYVMFDIINWSGTYTNKLMENNTIITLPSLKTALNADRGLSELIENLFVEEEDYGTIGAFHQVDANLPSSPPSKQSDTKGPTSLSSYEKICQTFKGDEFAFMEDVSTICNVFKRRLESGIGTDSDGRRTIRSIFGNIAEIFELTIKIHRTIEDGLEMSDPPALGAGLAELAEGMEFDVWKIEFIRQRQMVKLSAWQAVKFVLPSILYSVYSHFGSYLKYIKLLHSASPSEVDKSDLYDVEGYLTMLSKQIDDLHLPLGKNIEKQTKRNRRTAVRSDHIGTIIQIQRSIEGWVGKEIGFVCNEFIREGDLFKLRHAENLLRGKGYTERHIFLFDHLLVICKTVKSSKGVTYKYKDQFDIRKIDIFDLEDDEDVKNAFKVRSGQKENERQVTLFCHNLDEKIEWLTSLSHMQTAGILHRMRDAYLKEEERRIPLMIPTPSEYRFAMPDTDENVVFEDYTHNSGVPVVRSGTILKLVERLTYPHYIDNEFVKTFMTTYRSFCSPPDLLALLIERFNIPVPQVFAHLEQQPIIHSPKSGGPCVGRYDTVQSHGLQAFQQQIAPANLEHAYRRFREEYKRPIQQKVMKILHHWVRYHFYDFESDSELTEHMIDFLSGNNKAIKIAVPLKKLCIKIVDAIKRKLSESNADQQIEADEELALAVEKQNESTFGPDMPETVWHVAKKDDVNSYDLLTLHPLEIGRQVTLLHFNLYKAIKPIELVDAAWMKQEKYQRSPQLLKLTDHSTKLTYWIAKSIVETESLEERVEMMSRVLEIMVTFEELNNFSGIVAFYSALNSSSVFRLKETKSRLDRDKLACYVRFSELCQPHWKEMLLRLRNINPPCVPFPGTYLTQIFFFKTDKSTYVQPSNELNSTDDVDNQNSNRKLISFVKCRKIAAVIREIQMYQNQPYCLKVEPSIWQFFESINPLNGFRDKDEFETYLYDQSNKIEPKDGEIQHLKPKHSAEALKSPGIKPPKGSSQSSTFQRSRTVPASAKMAPKSAVTSPVLKSPPAYPSQTTPSSAGTEESHFAIVDISPGGKSRYVGDAGRINPAFDYTSQPISGGSSSPKSPVLPASTPGGLSSLRRLPPAPLSANETRFNFPPGNAFFPLSQPPAVRRKSEKAPKPTPVPSANDQFPTKKAPPILAKSPAFPKSYVSAHYVVDNPEETAPPIPARLTTEKHLPPPLASDTLTHLIGSRSTIA